MSVICQATVILCARYVPIYPILPFKHGGSDWDSSFSYMFFSEFSLHSVTTTSWRCLPSLASLCLPASPWPGWGPPPPRPPPSSTPPPPSRTLTALPNSSELEPPPSESLDPELVSDLCSDPSSSVTPGTPPSSSSFSHTPSLVGNRNFTLISQPLLTGFALSEAMGLFCLMMAFLLLFAF